MKRFGFYSNFCERCERYFMRLKKKGDKVCIYCYKGNHDLRLHYPLEEVEEFLSTVNSSLYVVKDGKVYKVEMADIDDKGGKSVKLK